MKLIRKTLQGGGKLLFIDLPDSSSITAIIFAKVGSRYENEKLSGISHLIEHSIFKGSKKYPTSQIISFSLEGLGASIDAGTGKEYTYFMTKSVKENFEKVLDILLDIYANPIFDDSEIIKEKKVVLEEIRMYKDDPIDEVSKMFTQNLWKDQRIGSEISGKIGTVQNLQSNDLKNFVKKYYTKSNTQIVIAGDLRNLDNLPRVISQKLSNLSESNPSKPISAKNDLKIDQVIFKKDKVEQTHIVLGTYGVSLNEKDRFAAAVGNTILGQGMGSKLYRSIRHKYGLAYYINSGNLSYADTGSIYIRAGVDQKRFYKALISIKDEINSVIEGDFTEDELFRAKQMLKSALVLELDGSDSMGLYLGVQELLTNNPLTIEELKVVVDDVSKEDIVKIFKKMFQFPKLLSAISSNEIDISQCKDILGLIG